MNERKVMEKLFATKTNKQKNAAKTEMSHYICDSFWFNEVIELKFKCAIFNQIACAIVALENKARQMKKKNDKSGNDLRAISNGL